MVFMAQYFHLLYRSWQKIQPLTEKFQQQDNFFQQCIFSEQGNTSLAGHTHSRHGTGYANKKTITLTIRV